MRAVWSLWTKPLHASQHTGWPTQQHHLLSWILSVFTARQHFGETHLVTDSAGADLLVETLDLPFDSVDLSLDALGQQDPDWWSLGKLYAYRAQHEPFVHIDSDVFLWNPLPPELLAADIFAQSPETAPYGRSYYRPESIEVDIRRHGGFLPPEFASHLPLGGEVRAANCGILGGMRTDFIRHYADAAIQLVEHPDNAAAWATRPRRDQDCVTVEQLTLTACEAWHSGREASPFRDVRLAYLFWSEAAAFSEAEARGYTHLVAGAKREPQALAALEQIVARAHPDRYSRVVDLCTKKAQSIETKYTELSAVWSRF